MSSRSRLTLASLCLCFALCGPVAAKPVHRGPAVPPAPVSSLWEHLTAKLGYLLTGTCGSRGGLDPWGCPTVAAPTSATASDVTPSSCDNRGGIDPWGCPLQ